MRSKKTYKIGISGHRDLLPEKEEEYLNTLINHLQKIQKEHPRQNLCILTPLAEGADRLMAKAALKLHIAYDVILPMPLELYREDFSPKSQEIFNYYLSKAKHIKTIPFYAGNTAELVSKSSIHRAFQYRQVGREIVDQSDEMIFMSDGIVNHKMGGTEDIAAYAQKCGKIFFKIRCERVCA